MTDGTDREGLRGERRRRTWGVEEQEEAREACEPVCAVHLCDDGGDEGEKTAAEEAVQDRKRHLCRRVSRTRSHKVLTMRLNRAEETEEYKQREKGVKLTMPA